MKTVREMINNLNIHGIYDYTIDNQNKYMLRNSKFIRDRVQYYNQHNLFDYLLIRNFCSLSDSFDIYIEDKNSYKVKNLINSDYTDIKQEASESTTGNIKSQVKKLCSIPMKVRHL